MHMTTNSQRRNAAAPTADASATALHQSRTGGISSSPPSPVADPPAATARPLAPPYGAEPPDYDKWKYGYPPCSGRMFGSGN
jgi:hypothetical protein